MGYYKGTNNTVSQNFLKIKVNYMIQAVILSFIIFSPLCSAVFSGFFGFIVGSNIISIFSIFIIGLTCFSS